jgi:hypothetical protein
MVTRSHRAVTTALARGRHTRSGSDVVPGPDDAYQRERRRVYWKQRWLGVVAATLAAMLTGCADDSLRDAGPPPSSLSVPVPAEKSP